MYWFYVRANSTIGVKYSYISQMSMKSWFLRQQGTSVVAVLYFLSLQMRPINTLWSKNIWQSPRSRRTKTFKKFLHALELIRIRKRFCLRAWMELSIWKPSHGMPNHQTPAILACQMEPTYLFTTKWVSASQWSKAKLSYQKFKSFPCKPLSPTSSANLSHHSMSKSAPRQKTTSNSWYWKQYKPNLLQGN